MSSPSWLQGWGPLHSAASAGHEAVVEYLLKLGAEVDAVTSGQRTPLHYAVRPQPDPSTATGRVHS
jgi:ankyrin repeat protein